MTETARVTPEGRALWGHASADDVVPSQNLLFAGGSTGFTVRGPELAGRAVPVLVGLSGSGAWPDGRAREGSPLIAHPNFGG